MAYFNAKAEREREQRDNNPDRILQIARAKGSFSVSLRWRDDALRAVCNRMKKSGLLTGGRKIVGGRVTFYPASVGTHPEGQDGEAGLVRSMGDAVPKADAQTTPSENPS